MPRSHKPDRNTIKRHDEALHGASHNDAPWAITAPMDTSASFDRATRQRRGEHVTSYAAADEDLLPYLMLDEQMRQEEASYE